MAARSRPSAITRRNDQSKRIEPRLRLRGALSLSLPGYRFREAASGSAIRDIDGRHRPFSHHEDSTMKKLSIGTWAYLFNQEKPTTDFHEILHKLQHLGYDGVELGAFGVHPTPMSHPTRASRQALKKEVADHGLAFS